MSLITFDPAAFKAQFPQFSNSSCFPDGTLNNWWVIATTVVSPEPVDCDPLTDAQRTEVLNLESRHVGTIFNQIASGKPAPAMVTSATIDKVTVTVKPPPERGQLTWWLNFTPYGQMAATILSIAGAGGFYSGGLPERSAFRRVGGGFGGPWPNCGG